MKHIIKFIKVVFAVAVMATVGLAWGISIAFNNPQEVREFLARELGKGE